VKGWRSRPVSRILSRASAGAAISLGAALPRSSCSLPGSIGRATRRPFDRAPCLALLRVGFAEPRRSPGALVSSYLTVSPLPLLGAVCFLWHYPRVAPPGDYPAPCPAESGLSSTRWGRGSPASSSVKSIGEPIIGSVGVRVPILFLVSLSLLSCDATSGESSQEASEPVSVARLATAGLENAAIREVVVEFLRGYAASGSDTRPLAQVVDGPHLEDWVYWLTVQNLGLQGRISGDLQLRALRILEIGDEAAAAAVDATVTLTLPAEAGLNRLRRRFGSLVILARADQDPDSWRVVDATRDGRSMQESITLFESMPARVDQAGIRVQVVSLYRFSSGTVVNVRIENTTTRTLRVDAPHSILQVADRFLGATGSTATLQRRLRPGGSIDGALNFPSLPLASTPQLVMVHFRGENAPVATVELPQEAFALQTA
jgi:hypothetical protein